MSTKSSLESILVLVRINIRSGLFWIMGAKDRREESYVVKITIL